MFFLEVKTAKPGSARTLTGLLTTNQPESIGVAMRNNNTQREKILLFAVCNAYVQCTAWRTSIAVFVHFSAISRMRHAAHNGAVFFDGVGMASTDAITNDTPRRPLMVGCYVYLSGYAYPGWYGILLIISQCITSDRPIMVLLVGERSRSLANLLASIPTPASDATITTVKKCLRTYNGLGYVYPAPHKTGAGICSPKLIKATPDAASVFFVVRYTHHSMVWYAIQQQSYNRRSTAILSYHAAHNGAMCAPYDGLPSGSRSRNRTSRRQRMVTLAGQPQGWPVPFIAGTANPVNVTAPIEICSSRGDSLNQIKEAVTMVNASPCPCPLFVWRFFSCQQSTYHTVTATSEREARVQLPDAPCLFAARIRLEEVRHV
ncbi:host cell division inhibitor Icd-like protein [Salmonella enterica]|nr:host cell division inhibitor Icd-like protein [Salmonella enterica]